MAATSKISRWEIHRGRQDELEKTGTGEATIFVNDVEGLYDPSNTASPYFSMLDGAQVAITLRNPVTNTYHTRFRGSVEEYGYDLHESQVNTEVAINCVDLFDYLSTCEMKPGDGFLPLPEDVQDQQIFYENGEANLRIWHDFEPSILGDAGIPAELKTVFTLNVEVQEAVYDSGYSFLAALQDAVDAEFPGVGNAYVSAEGKVTVHGRHARFSPDSVAAGAGAAWNFTRWKVGDGDAIAADSAYAQLRPPLHYDRSMKMIYNSARITPMTDTLNVTDADLDACFDEDTASIAQYGTRSYTADGLHILRHKPTATNNNDAIVECALMCSYYVINYSQPRTRPRQITVRSLPPNDSRAAATWAFLCGVEISDIIHLKVTNPGGGGFDEDFYVEGISTVCEPSSADYDIVEVTCDVSPQAYYTDVFDDP